MSFTIKESEQFLTQQSLTRTTFKEFARVHNRDNPYYATLFKLAGDQNIQPAPLLFSTAGRDWSNIDLRDPWVVAMLTVRDLEGFEYGEFKAGVAQEKVEQILNELEKQVAQSTVQIIYQVYPNYFSNNASAIPP